MVVNLQWSSFLPPCCKLALVSSHIYSSRQNERSSHTSVGFRWSLNAAFIRGIAGDFFLSSCSWRKGIGILKRNNCEGEGKMYNSHQSKFWERSDGCGGAGVMIEVHGGTDETLQPCRVCRDRFRVLPGKALLDASIWPIRCLQRCEKGGNKTGLLRPTKNM